MCCWCLGKDSSPDFLFEAAAEFESAIVALVLLEVLSAIRSNMMIDEVKKPI